MSFSVFHRKPEAIVRDTLPRNEPRPLCECILVLGRKLLLYLLFFLHISCAYTYYSISSSCRQFVSESPTIYLFLHTYKVCVYFSTMFNLHNVQYIRLTLTLFLLNYLGSVTHDNTYVCVYVHICI